MSTGFFVDEEGARADSIDRWFRELDQRRIYYGPREWLVQVTSILREPDDVLWIQIADDTRFAGSVLLRVLPTTPVEQAVGALAARPQDSAGASPHVLSALLPPWMTAIPAQA